VRGRRESGLLALGGCCAVYLSRMPVEQLLSCTCVNILHQCSTPSQSAVPKHVRCLYGSSAVLSHTDAQCLSRNATRPGPHPAPATLGTPKQPALQDAPCRRLCGRENVTKPKRTGCHSSTALAGSSHAYNSSAAHQAGAAGRAARAAALLRAGTHRGAAREAGASSTLCISLHAAARGNRRPNDHHMTAGPKSTGALRSVRPPQVAPRASRRKP